MFIPIYKPSVKRKEMDAVLSALVEDRLGHGAVTQNLVKEVCLYLGLDSGIALREYGRAIETVLDCLEIKSGDHIIISPLSPSVYMEVCLSRGVEPLFADIDPDSGCVSVESISALVNKRPAAIIIHETLGFMPDMEAIKDLSIPMIEDISHSIGANSGVKKSGTYGNYVIVSMEPENIITSGGGALVLAGGKKEAAVLKKLASELHGTVFLQDMNAALGLIQIKRLESFVLQRKDIAQIYLHAAMQSRHSMLVQKGEAENVYFSFPVLVNTGAKDVIQYARKKNIEAVSAFEDSILGRFEISEQDIGNAQSMVLRCVLFPLYPMLGKSNISSIEKVLATLP